MRKAGSPIIRAASACCNIAGKSGGDSKNCGAIFHFSAHRMRVSVCVLREPASSAKLFTCSIGFFAMTNRLRTCRFEAMAISCKITKSSMRWYSIAGMMATSARPERKSSAHCEGTVNDKSYLPSSGPLVKPQTSGAVLRYWTIEMRSLVTVRGLTSKFQYNKEGFSERQPSLSRNCPATSECWNRSKTRQRRPRTPHPPINLHECQKKGLTKRAFRKRLILKDAILVVSDE